MVDAEEILDMVNHDVSEAAVDGECLVQVNHCFVQLSLCFYNIQRERERERVIHWTINYTVPKVL